MAFRIDSQGATADNQFTEGNPAGGVAPTEVSADWLNMVQGEFAAVVEDAGLTLDKNDNTQLNQAIDAKIAAAVPDVAAATTDAAGIVELATNAEAVAGTDTERAITPAGVKAAIAANGVTLEQILMYS